ncbi:MAG: restriction endonuclease subunit S [Deltaproteobacteria bacterium]|nr:restriction endonuclease subunit S [Deltaproteobacteria bacterium]
MKTALEMKKLPHGWKTKKISKVLERLSPGPLRNTTSNQQIGKVPVVSQSENGFVGYHDGIAGVTASSDNPIVTFANHTCAVRWHESPFSTIQNVFPLRGKRGVMETGFLYWILKWAITPSFYGGHWPILVEKVVPLPPIEEQHRIAISLKAQMAEVEKARKAAEVQFADAEALSRAYLQEVFEGKSLERWQSVSLGDAGEVVSGITLGRKTENKELRKVPYLRVANVKDGHLDLSEIKTIEATEIEIEKWRLQAGDILLTEGGDPDKLGRGTFWSDELPECIHQNHIFRVRFPADKYLPEFVSAQIGSPYGKAYFLAHAKKTTGIATINQKVLKAFPLFSPPLEKQKEVTASLSEKLKETLKIAAGFRKRLDEINILPNRLLAQAFEMN